MDADYIYVKGFILQEFPKIYVAKIEGRWLLSKTTPSWRIDDPELGFQRTVKEDRARAIANNVLNQQRTFPNAIILATDVDNFHIEETSIRIPINIKFLVVDGQHRLWAQNFSEYEAQFACVIHMGLSEKEMATLFLEINDNQKKVSPSLRWDLVRLVRPDDDPYTVASAEMIYQLSTDLESPLFQRIDLTGEQSEIYLKQASIAPEIKTLLSRKSPVRDLSFDEQYNLIVNYLLAVKDLDPDNWGKQKSIYYQARILRALIRLLPDLVTHNHKAPTQFKYWDFLPDLQKINPETLSPEAIRAVQGSAGIKDIYDRIYRQIFPGETA